MTNFQRIDQLVAEIREMMSKPALWEPTETDPVKVVQERRKHENKMNTIATTIRLTGGRVKPSYEIDAQ